MGEIKKDYRGNTYVRVDNVPLSLIQKYIRTNVNSRDVYTSNYLGLDKKDIEYKNACWIRLPKEECEKITSASNLSL